MESISLLPLLENMNKKLTNSCLNDYDFNVEADEIDYKINKLKSFRWNITKHIRDNMIDMSSDSLMDSIYDLEFILCWNPESRQEMKRLFLGNQTYYDIWTKGIVRIYEYLHDENEWSEIIKIIGFDDEQSEDHLKKFNDGNDNI
ncbi:MAG: hypothetical protein HKN68_01835 [Saprospiraceae bacterium]|nr:hypothetical protein [Saprospiraceae bacterium]